MRTVFLVFVAFLMLFAPSLAGAAAGDLDPTFGTGGIARLRTGHSWDAMSGVGFQPDGRIVAAGVSGHDNDYLLVAVRYNANGTLDPTFGEEGRALVSIGSGASDPGRMVVQPDGKILVATCAKPPSQSALRWAVIRLDANGALDPAFGSGGKAFITSVTDGSCPKALLLQPDGGMILAGGYSQFKAVRLLADGSADSSFSGSNAPSFSSAGVSAAALGADGKVVVVGFAVFPSLGSGSLIVRFDANGNLDTTFAGTGYVQIPDQTTQFNAIAVRPDGRIVAGGGQNVSPSYRFVLAQYLADGSVDFDFGSAGRALLPLSNFNVPYSLPAIKILPDGRMLASGGSSSEAYMFRLTAAGELDPGFGGVGYVSFLSPDYPIGPVTSFAQRGDGRIVAGGSVYHRHSGGQHDESAFRVALLQSNGIVDHTFAGTGVAYLNDVAYGQARVYDVGLLADGRIVAIGHDMFPWNPRSFAAFGLLPDGHLDGSFADGGRLLTDVGPYMDFGGRLLARPDGKFYIGGEALRVGSGGSHFALARYNANGTLDSSFGSGGRLVPMFGGVDDSSTWHDISDLALAPGGKLLAIGSSSGSQTRFGMMRFLDNGAPDASFNPQAAAASAGQIVTGYGPFTSHANRVAVLADGRFLVVGSYYPAGTPISAIARYMADGSLDTTFGSAGYVFGTFDDGLSDIQVLPDGRFLVAGKGTPPAGVKGFAIARFLADGSLDPTFGANGRAWVDFGMGASVQRLILDDGKILLAGAASNDVTQTYAALARLDAATGVLDTSFAIGGKALTPVGPYATVSFARQRDGHLLVGGYSFDSNTSISSAFVMRLQNPDFRPDPFTFATASARPRSTGTQSGTLSLPGFNQPTTISVANGEYSIGCNGTFTAAPGTIAAGQTVCVRHVSSSRAGGRTTTTLDIGGMAGTFTSITTPEQDLSGEGRADLVWKGADARVAIWLMDGLALTAAAEVIGPNTGWAVERTADFDGDGKADLVWRHADGRIAIYLMAGINVQATAQLLPASTGWRVTRTPDLDGDGRADLLFTNDDGTVAAWLMDGLAIKEGSSLLGMGTGWRVAGVGDLDGDRRDDIVFVHDDGRVAVWLMNGLAPHATQQILNAGSGWTFVQLADLDGDGKDDIVWQQADGRLAAWLMNGGAMASGAEILAPATGWSVAHAADFDGDGKADLLLSHVDGRAAIWLMNGLTPHTQAQILNAASGWTARRVLDLDGDGKGDIVWQHDDGRVSVWLMNGAAMSTGSGILGAGTGWSVSP